MTLSIIIVSYNTRELLKKCLESLVSSIKYQVLSIEIIIIDNGSTDSSQEVIKKYLIPNTGYLIHLIENQSNLGFARAVNQGIKESGGELVFLLNSDTIVKPGALEKLVEFEKQVRPAIVGSRLINPDGTIQPSVFNLPGIKRAIQEYWFGKENSFSKFAPMGDVPVEVEAVSGGAMLISKAIIEKIGMLDERYFFYFEDLDYCRRARKYGFKIFYLPTAKIIHEHGASGKTLADSENQWRRLVPSSKIYYGLIKHYLINLIIRLGRKK